MKLRLIEESELEELLCDSLRLAALDQGGIDDWMWYGESMIDFINRYNEENHTNYLDFYEIVREDLMSDYQEVAND